MRISMMLLATLVISLGSTAANASDDETVVMQPGDTVWVPDQWIESACGTQLIPGHYVRIDPPAISAYPRSSVIIVAPGYHHDVHAPAYVVPHHDHHVSPHLTVPPIHHAPQHDSHRDIGHEAHHGSIHGGSGHEQAHNGHGHDHH